jgi:uncharacterized damage-inducible protein DinB
VTSKLAGAIFDMWKDVDRAFADLSEADALERHGGGSAFAWTLVHIANFEDGQINFRTRGRERHAMITDQFERFRESPGSADQWERIKAGVQELREELRSYLEGLSEEEIATTMAAATARTAEQPLALLLWRDIAHTYYHIGEVAAKRDQLGQRTGDYPSVWESAG